MRPEDWTKEEWEMTIQLERLTAQNAEEKQQELSQRRKSASPHKRKKDWLRYAGSLSALAVLLYFVLDSILLGLLGSLWGSVEPALPSDWRLQGQAVYRALALLLPAAGLVAARFLIEKGAQSTPMKLKPQKRWPEQTQVWIFVPVFMGVSVLGDMLTSAVRYVLEHWTVYPAEQSIQLPENPLGVWYYFLALCVVPAVVDEWLVRGALQRIFEPWGAWFSIVVSSVMFTLMSTELAQMPTVFIESVLMGLAAHCTGTLTVGIMLHFSSNFISFAFLVIEQKMQGVESFALMVYLLGVIFLAAVVCIGIIYEKQILRSFRQIPRVYDPKNRQSRVERLATTPLYIVVMLAMALRAVWPMTGWIAPFWLP